MSLGLIAYNTVQKLKESGGAGYAAYETRTGIGFRGDIGERAVIPGETLGLAGTFVHVSDIVATGNKVLEAVINSSGNVSYDVRNPLVHMTDDGVWMLLGERDGSNDFVYALSFNQTVAQQLGVPAGTYFWTENISGGTFFVSYVRGDLTETVHPIDPKFLPGVCLPVVELSEETLLADSSDSAFSLTPAESAQMEKAYATGLPCVVRIKLVAEDGADGVLSGIASLNLVTSGDIMAPAYIFTLKAGGFATITVARALDGSWFRPAGE